MTLGLKIEIEQIERHTILRLDGRLDVATAPQLEKKIESLRSERPFLILDFARVDYLSSAGLRVLLAASKKLKSQKGVLLIASMGEEVFEVVQMAGLDKVLSIFETEAEALRHTL